MESIAEALHDRIGDQLRVVGHHETDSWTVSHARDDVADSYDTDDIDTIADELRLDTVGDSRQEDIYELGDLKATIRLFEAAMVVHVPTDRHAGYLVSIDEDADIVGRDVVAFVRSTVAGTKS